MSVVSDKKLPPALEAVLTDKTDNDKKVKRCSFKINQIHLNHTTIANSNNLSKLGNEPTIPKTIV